MPAQRKAWLKSASPGPVFLKQQAVRFPESHASPWLCLLSTSIHVYHLHLPLRPTLAVVLRWFKV